MGLKMSKLAVDTQTVLKTLGFLLQVFFDFSSHFLVDRNSWWLKNPTKTRGSYAPSRGLWRLEGGEVPALWTRVNHIPLKGQKNKRRVVLGSTQDSFYSEGKYRLVQIWQRQTALFSVLKEFWAASFGFCYLSSSLRSHRNRHHNRWRLMIPKPYGESTHVKLGPFFFKKKTWTTLPTFKVDSLKQPSKLIHRSNLQSCFIEPTPKTYIYQNRKGEFWPCKIWEGPIPPVPSGDLHRWPHVYDGDGARSAQGRATEMSRGAGSGEDGQGGLGGALGRQQKPKGNQQNLLKASQPPFF